MEESGRNTCVEQDPTMDISIISVNYNTCQLLQTCLASVYKETKDILFETIVVDNASTDGSREMLAKEFPQVRTILNDSNKGFAAANNQGIKSASGRYILLLNSDTKIIDGSLQKTVAFMDSNMNASIVGCTLLNADGSLQPSCMGFPSVWNLFSESFFLYIIFRKTKLFGSYYMTFFDYDVTRKVDVVKGAFMMIRKEVFLKTGLLDESYFMYTEETDFCYRARQHGFDTFFFPSAQVVHYGGGSVESALSFLRQVHRTQFLFIKKHFTGFQKYAGILIKQLGMAIRVPLYFLLGIVTFDVRTIRKSTYYCLLLGESFR